MKERSKHKIAIFMPYDALIFSPSLINAITLLRKSGYLVDLVLPKGNQLYSSNVFMDNGVNFIYYYYYKNEGLWEILKSRIHFFLVSFSKCHKNEYKCFFGIDVYGLIVASLMSVFNKAPVVYFSTELTLSVDNLWRKYSIRYYLYKLRKSLEMLCHHFSVFTIIQDEERARILAIDNKVKVDNMLIVPNSSFDAPRATDTHWWHTFYSIADHKKIILHEGTIDDWTCCYELAMVALSWSDEFVLIIHGKVEKESYLQKIKSLIGDAKKVFLSVEVFPYEKLDLLISSACIGIALYKNLNMNHYVMSSGKISHYLRCGLPVIAQRFPSIESIIVKNNCGVCVENCNEVESAIHTILNNYQEFSLNAKKFYSQKLDFKYSFTAVIEKIDRLQ